MNIQELADSKVEAHIELFRDGILVINSKDNGEYFIYLPSDDSIHFLDLGDKPNQKCFLATQLNSYAEGKGLVESLIQRAFVCDIKYNPYIPSRIIQNKDFNKYKRKTLKPLTQKYLPLIYDFYFRNMIPDEVSRTQVIDWLSSGLKEKLQTILVMIAPEGQGIGKTTLGEILIEMLGEDNASILSKRVLTSRFNGGLEDKHFVLINEAKIKNEEDEDRAKELTDSKLDVEKKSINSKSIQNHCNYIIATNNEGGFIIKRGDRRYKVIDTTSEAMITWDFSELGIINTGGDAVTNFRKLLFDTDNIAMLYDYLINHHKITTDPHLYYYGSIMADVEHCNIPKWCEEIFTVAKWELSHSFKNGKLPSYEIQQYKSPEFSVPKMEIKKYTVYKKLREYFNKATIVVSDKDNIQYEAQISIKKRKDNTYFIDLTNVVKKG